MNPELWERIKQIHHAALELEPGRREEFIKEACLGDESLLKEVTSLLAQDGKSEGLFDSPAIDAVARAVAKEKANKPQQNLTGHTVLHYRIEKKIGQGGMGEVYLAQDTSLNRRVALKFLPPEMQQDPVAHKRFLREARSAAALDNPYICSIHEVGESEGKDFIVMEYVDGQTLTEKLRGGRLPLNQALQIAIEIAEALQAAHGKGIVHRDLKPSNIMLMKTGHAKVMDFGLAKQIIPSGGVGSQEESVTAMTRSGMTLGTLAYMSPEQVRGEELDARSDIFSLGLVLYEMLTGRHPFRRENPMETASAILQEEPQAVGVIAKGIPVELEKLVGRCLRKDAARRIQHIDDVKLALDELKQESDSGRLQAKPATPRRFTPVRLLLIAAAAVALMAAGWYWLGRQRRAEPGAPLIAVPLTSYPGYESYPSFSPDGTQVAFQWCTEEPAANCDIYVKQIGMEPPSRMTSDPAEDSHPAWSPDGQFIAFLRQLSPTRMALMLIPQRGGQERVLGEADIHLVLVRAWQRSQLAWTPDSRWLVLPWGEAGKPATGLYMLSVETREARRLTTSEFASTPAVSPDGQTLAFNGGISRDLIYLLRLAKDYQPEGEPAHVAPAGESLENYGLAWSPDGKDIVFSSGDSAKRGLWRVEASAGATPRRLAFASEGASAPAVSRQGNRLAYVVFRSDANIWRIDLPSPGQNPGVPVRLIASTRQEQSPAYSPDGKRIAFTSDRSGAREIWVCASDGSNPVQLTAFGGPGVYSCTWSPDGQNIAFAASQAGNQDLYVVSANGGPVRRVTTYPGIDGLPYWSRDGQSLYFKSTRPNLGDIWKMPAIGGEAVQITRNGGDAPQESPDGRFVYYEKGWPWHCSVWRVPAAGGEEVKVLDSTHSEAGWTVAKQGIYFFTPPDGQGRSDICLYKFSTGKTSKILTIERGVTYRIAVSPDERTILYGQYDQVGSDLMLVENFR